MMKRIFFAAALCILFLGFAPEVSAMPGDCFSTCNVYAACGTETCQECVWPYSDTECIQWGYAECQWYGLCGQTQPCYTVREYDTYTAAGNWQFVQRVCFRESSFRPEKPVEEYAKRYLKKHYRVTNCQGVETTELVYETYVYDHCYKDYPLSCRSSWPRTSFYQLPCPF